MKLFLLSLGLAVVLKAVSEPLPATDVVTSLQVSPLVQAAPGKVLYTIRITPHRDNIWFCYGWDNIDTADGKTSCQQLNGIYSPRIFQQEYKWLKSGHYVGFVRVYRAPSYIAGTAPLQFIVD